MADTPIRVTENPFGEFSDEQMAGDPGAPDRFYLKGYSDKRHEREVLIREMGKGKIPQQKLPTLDRRFHWVSVEKPDGSPNREQVVRFQALKYRAAKWDELASLGIQVDESNVVRGADGTVRVGTQMLMVTD